MWVRVCFRVRRSHRLCFLIHACSLYNRIRKISAQVLLDLLAALQPIKTVGTLGRKTATLGKVWSTLNGSPQEWHPGLDYGYKLGFLHVHKSKRGQPKKKIEVQKRFTDCWFRRTTGSEEFENTGNYAWLWTKIIEIIERLGGVIQRPIWSNNEADVHFVDASNGWIWASWKQLSSFLDSLPAASLLMIFGLVSVTC